MQKICLTCPEPLQAARYFEAAHCRLFQEKQGTLRFAGLIKPMVDAGYFFEGLISGIWRGRQTPDNGGHFPEYASDHPDSSAHP